MPLAVQVLEKFHSLREPWWDVIDAGRAEPEVTAVRRVLLCSPRSASHNGPPVGAHIVIAPFRWQDVRSAGQRAVERVAAGQPLRRLWDYK